MRTKTRTTTELKPGMVVRIPHADPATGLTAFRQVARVERLTPWAERFITFTDGTRLRYGNGGEFEVARSKAARNGAKARASLIAGHALAGALNLFAFYATAQS